VIYTLDSSALLAFLRRERGWQVVRNLLRTPGAIFYAHALTLAEVFYNVHRTGGEAAAQQTLRRLIALNITSREDLDAAFWQDAAGLKSVYWQASFADCCCAILAQRTGSTVVTADHPDFDPFAAAGICPVLFIR
jgi:predicted nucleic acid-binding protein